MATKLLKHRSHKHHHKDQKHHHKDKDHHHHHSLDDDNEEHLEHTIVTNTNDFNSMRTLEAFKACITKDGLDVDLPQLIIAYRELIK